MTTEQKQNLLAFLGYYEAKVDGIWGEKSQNALEAFQTEHGLDAGKFTEATAKALLEAVAAWKPDGTDAGSNGIFWDEIKYFDREEFRCTCKGRGCNGFPAEPRERLVRNAEAVRKYFGSPVTVSSGVRCRLRNSELPGSAANSLHLAGRAMDFRVEGKNSKFVLAFVRTLPEVREAYAIDANYVHMGIRGEDG
jgi:hypothetical protein